MSRSMESLGFKNAPNPSVDYSGQENNEDETFNIDEEEQEAIIPTVATEEREQLGVENINSQVELDKSFIHSFELAPDQRRKLRLFIDELKDPEVTLNEALRFYSLPLQEVNGSSYIQELVKSKFIDQAHSRNYFVHPRPSELIDKFGIEQEFFTQPILDEYRKQNWLQKINNGDKIDDNLWEKEFDWDEKIDQEAIEKKKNYVAIEYGEFAKIIPNPTLPEIKEIAKEGLVRAVERDASWRSVESVDSASIIEEYKNIFNITQEEFEQVIIDNFRSAKSYDSISLLEVEKIEKLRQGYPFIENFVNSPDGRALIHQNIEEKMIKGEHVDSVMEYYKLTSNDFDPVFINEKRKEWHKQDIIEHLNNNIRYAYYPLHRAKEIFTKDDWQEILSSEGYREIIIDVLKGEICEFHHTLAEVLDLAAKMDLSNEELKRIGSSVVVNLAGVRNNFRPENVFDIKDKFGLSDDEFKKAFSLGVLDTIDMGRYELVNREKEMQIKVEADSPELQTKLKEVYYKQLSNIELYNLDFIKERFNIAWTEDDRINREKALKQALCDNSRLNYVFQNAEKIEEFINANLPDKKMAIYLYSDRDIKNSIRQLLVDNALYGSSILKSVSFADKITQLFDVKDEAMQEIKAEIEGGVFIHNDQTLMSIFPEVNVREEKTKCLANHGQEILESALENKQWSILSDILENYADTPTGQELKNIFTQQEENILNDSKPIAIRTYAVEALTKVYQQNEQIEDKYFSKLIHIFSESDVKILASLFNRKTDKIRELSDTDRNLLFDTLISRASEVSQTYDNDPRRYILERDVITLLSDAQSREALEYNRYEVVTKGIKQVLDSKQEVPPYIYDNLYSRIKQEKEPPFIKATAGFTAAIEGLLKTSNYDLLQNQKILQELANKPESIPVIKKLFELPINLIANRLESIYDHFKNLPDDQFEKHIMLLKRLEKYRYLLENIDINAISMLERLSDYSHDDQEQFFSLLELESKPKTDFTDKDWAAGIVNYVSAAEDANRLRLNEVNKNKVVETFNGPYKDVALDGMRQSWQGFLKTNDKIFLPPELLLVSAYIEDAGGAGNLKHIESLGNFAYQINSLLENPKTTKRTKDEIKNMLNKQETRINKEKWSQDERSEFYNISHDIVEAAPSLYSSFSPLLEQLSPKEMKVFMSETLPLLQAELITKQNIDGREGEISYDPRQLVGVRQAIRHIAADIKENPVDKMEIFEKEKNRLIGAIKESFKERFGILQVPTVFTKENLRSVQNGIRYIGNINARDATSESIIAMYIALELNGKWGDFRQGKDIEPKKYLANTQLNLIRPILEEKMKSYNVPLEVAGISKDKKARFQELLQEEVSSSMMGNIQTVDVKLGNVKRNIEELTDPDIYNSEQEKEIMKLLGESGRMVGSVLAKTYAEAQGKAIEFNDEEREVQTRLSLIYGIKQWSPEQVKGIQDQVQPFSLITNMVNKMEEEKVDENIKELHQRLQPSDNIIKLFKSLGEDFSQESGAIALGKDLTYLESLLVKDDNKITPEQRTEVESYLNSIREKMEQLENTLDKVKEYYNKVKKSTHLAGHNLLNNRMAEVEKVLYSQDSNAMIVSRLTKDLNLIIENMRQCLGCIRKEINNDTNLAFGDYNKFFIINQAEKEKGSISDEIMFFVPIKAAEGKEEMSFVMDRVYGSKVPDVLISNILSVFKKYQAIKKEMPEAKISVTISQAAMASVGINSEILEKKLRSVLQDVQFNDHKDDLVATIPKSALSDNYVEFGGNARQSGERNFSGLVIR